MLQSVRRYYVGHNLGLALVIVLNCIAMNVIMKIEIIKLKHLNKTWFCDENDKSTLNYFWW